MISVKVTEQQKKAARKANLFEFLRTHHADAIELDKHGKTLRLTTNHSISIKDDYSGYLDFATNEHGNGIDLLTRYFGYNFQVSGSRPLRHIRSIFFFISVKKDYGNERKKS